MRSFTTLLSRTRVALFYAAALGTVVMTTCGSAQAANGDPVRAGSFNSATATTYIQTTGVYGLHASAIGESGMGVWAEGPNAGLIATSDGTGVDASGKSIGVKAESSAGTAIEATSYSANAVYAVTPDSTSAGVIGVNASPTNSGGSGVVGVANNNIGVSAISSNGTALAVSGVASFSRSGKAIVPKGLDKVVVPNVKLFGNSIVLTLPQQANSPLVKAAVPDIANHQVTIYLEKPASVNTTVGWFIVN